MHQLAGSCLHIDFAESKIVPLDLLLEDPVSETEHATEALQYGGCNCMDVQSLLRLSSASHTAVRPHLCRAFLPDTYKVPCLVFYMCRHWSSD